METAETDPSFPMYGGLVVGEVDPLVTLTNGKHQGDGEDCLQHHATPLALGLQVYAAVFWMLALAPEVQGSIETLAISVWVRFGLLRICLGVDATAENEWRKEEE